MSPKREPEAPWSLAAVGERAILREVLRKLRAASPDPALLVGAGDDAAAYRLPAGEAAILTTDTLVEGTHFRRPWAARARWR